MWVRDTCEHFFFFYSRITRVLGVLKFTCVRCNRKTKPKTKTNCVCFFFHTTLTTCVEIKTKNKTCMWVNWDALSLGCQIWRSVKSVPNSPICFECDKCVNARLPFVFFLNRNSNWTLHFLSVCFSFYGRFSGRKQQKNFHRL